MSRFSTHSRLDKRQPAARAFTLIELLVAIVIMLILVGVTVSVVNISLDGERIRAGARDLQSYLMGARDRAVHSKMARGVRFELDPNSDPSRPLVRSVVYIGASSDWQQGSITVRRNGTNGRPELLRGEFTEWYALKLRGSLVNGARIKLGNRWYTVSTIPLTSVNNEWLHISPPLVDPQPQDEPDPAFQNYPIVMRINEGDYRLELRPRVLPNAQAKQLPQGIVIDLAYCRVPSSTWKTATSDRYRDVMFSPRGTVTGSAAAAGVIHFLLNEQADAESKLEPWLPANQGDKRVISLFTRTGNVTTSELFPYEDFDHDGQLDPGEDLNGNGQLDTESIFYYAERGEVSE